MKHSNETNNLELNKLIESRHSIRKYLQREIEPSKIETILSAGICAPSGKNGKPWKFIVVQKDKTLLKRISAQTIYDIFVKKILNLDNRYDLMAVITLGYPNEIKRGLTKKQLSDCILNNF